LGPTKKQLGERAQAHVIAKFLEIGHTVLLPYGDSSRYDLVIEDAEERFWRVQVIPFRGV
jgi:PD-(D/E)XK endonuclease